MIPNIAMHFDLPGILSRSRSATSEGWENMFITQPTMHAMHLTTELIPLNSAGNRDLCGPLVDYRKERGVTLHDERGLRMGAVVEHFHSKLLHRDSRQIEIGKYRGRLGIVGCIEWNSPWVDVARDRVGVLEAMDARHPWPWYPY